MAQIFKLKKTVVISTAPSSITGGALIHTNILKLFSEDFLCTCHFVGYEKPYDFNPVNKIIYSFPCVNSDNSLGISNSLATYSITEEIIRLAKEYKKKNYNIILFASFLFPFGEIIINAAAILRSKTIFCKTLLLPTGSDIWKIGNQLKDISKYIINASSIAFTYSPSFRDEIYKFLQSTKEVHVIPPIINTDFFKPTTQANKKAIRKRLSLLPSDLIFCHVSNLRFIKGLPLMFDILDEVANESKLNIVLLIVGPKTTDITKLLEKATLDTTIYSKYSRYTYNKVSIQYFGPKKNVKPYIHASDFAINTSYHDSFNTSLAEALSCGLPVVTSSVIGLLDYNPPPNIIISYKCPKVNYLQLNKSKNIQIKFSDVKKIALEILGIVKQDKDPKEISQYCHDFIFNNFSKSILREKYFNLLNENTEDIKLMLSVNVQRYYAFYYDTFQANLILSKKSTINERKIIGSNLKNLIPANCCLIDIGAGNCQWLEFISENVLEYIAVDVNKVLLSNAKKKYSHIKSVNADIFSETFNYEIFKKVDVILISFFLSHFNKNTIEKLLYKLSLYKKTIVIIDSIQSPENIKFNGLKLIDRRISEFEKIKIPKRYFFESDIFDFGNFLNQHTEMIYKGKFWFLAVFNFR